MDSNSDEGQRHLSMVEKTPDQETVDKVRNEFWWQQGEEVVQEKQALRDAAREEAKRRQRLSMFKLGGHSSLFLNNIGILPYTDAKMGTNRFPKVEGNAIGEIEERLGSGEKISVIPFFFLDQKDVNGSQMIGVTMDDLFTLFSSSDQQAQNSQKELMQSLEPEIRTSIANVLSATSFFKELAARLPLKPELANYPLISRKIAQLKKSILEVQPILKLAEIASFSDALRDRDDKDTTLMEYLQIMKDSLREVFAALTSIHKSVALKEVSEGEGLKSQIEELADALPYEE
jgi:hypothetical protein